MIWISERSFIPNLFFTEFNFNILCNRFIGTNSLLNAAFGGHNEIVQLLVESGVDVNAKDDRG